SVAGPGAVEASEWPRLRMTRRYRQQERGDDARCPEYLAIKAGAKQFHLISDFNMTSASALHLAAPNLVLVKVCLVQMPDRRRSAVARPIGRRSADLHQSFEKCGERSTGPHFSLANSAKIRIWWACPRRACSHAKIHPKMLFDTSRLFASLNLLSATEIC